MRIVSDLLSATMLPQPDTDICRLDCYLPYPVFPMFPLLNVRIYSGQGQKGNHAYVSQGNPTLLRQRRLIP